MRYPIRLDNRYRVPLLLVLGVLHRTAFAAIEGDRLVARFGWFSVRTTLWNIERWEVSGPYRWYRAIGLRQTVGKAEISFGGATHGGIALFFRQPIPFWWVRGLRVLYVGLDDLEGFAAELTRRGVPGADVRRA